MTKEDEARLAVIRSWAEGAPDATLLLRLLDEATAERDEQAARVAAAEAQLREVHEVFQRGGDFQLGPKGRHRGLAERIEAAIRARDGSPECCGNVGCINWDRPPGYAGTNGPCRCPVAPGEVKP